MMNYFYNSFGWLCAIADDDRKTEIAPPDHGEAPIVGEPWPLWSGATGEEWVLSPYVEPPVIEASPHVGIWKANDFLTALTQAERIDIRNFAKTDDYAADFMDLLYVAIQTGNPFACDNANLVGGLNYLRQNNKLTSERVAELLQGPK